MQNNSLSIIVVVICIVIIITHIYIINKSLKKYPKRFLYLNLRVNQSNAILKIKEESSRSLNKMGVAFSLVLLSTLLLKIEGVLLLDIMFLLTYFIIIHFIIEKSVNKIKIEKLELKDYSSKIKFGGLYYNNKEDNNTFIDFTMIFKTINYASVIGKVIGVLMISIVILLIYAMTKL